MAALIHQIMDMASDPAVSTTDLLRRSLVAARRLDVPELSGWITSELEGYGDRELLDYRSIKGRPQTFNPYHGFVPMVFESAEWADAFATANISQSLPELEQLAKCTSGLRMSFPAEIEQKLRSLMAVPLEPSIDLQPTQLHGIVEKVRSRILKWALDLEGQGVLGEGMAFTQREKDTVRDHHYHFNQVSGSQIQIASNGSTQSAVNSEQNLEALRDLVEALSKAVTQSEIASNKREELQAELATLRAQAASPNPKWEVIKATARSIKTVAEGAGGSLLAELSKPHIQTLLNLAGG